MLKSGNSGRERKGDREGGWRGFYKLKPERGGKREKMAGKVKYLENRRERETQRGN